MLYDILEWFWENLPTISCIFIFALLIGMIVFCISLHPSQPDSERIERVSEGKLINMRFLGSWYSNTELKFDNGSMTVVPFWFSRELRENKHYKIWWSSKTGWHYKEIK